MATRVRIIDTTHHKDYGSLREGTVHEVSDEDALRWIQNKIAVKTGAPVTAAPSAADQLAAIAPEDGAEEASLDEPLDTKPSMPSIGRDDVEGLTAERVRRGGR